MTIKNSEPLSMPEVEEYLDKSSDLTKFIKKFTKETPKSAGELRKNLEQLGAHFKNNRNFAGESRGPE